MSVFSYVGNELELFAKAHNWKRYYRSHLVPFLRGDVLEVGAGLGSTTQVLCDGRQRSWLCLEPDPLLAAELQTELSSAALSLKPEVRVGFVSDLPADRLFDCVLYIDVLEHIEDDSAELGRAAEHLRPGGHIVVLAPAHNQLFSEFDRAIGHYRRYNRGMLEQLRRPGLDVVKSCYLDSVGTFVNLAARFVVKASHPTEEQIAFWDRCIVPVSRVLDPLLLHRIGKTVVVVFERDRVPPRPS